MKDTELLFVPLGGVGEIGMNLALYGYGKKTEREWIMVDCGITFPGPDLPGVDLVFPDIRYAQELGKQLKAIIITHAHEDHYGGLLSLWPMLKKPVYCTEFCAHMLEAKAVYEREKPDIPINIYKAGDNFSIGSFQIESVQVTHSLPESMLLSINSPLGTVVHTGDWKIDRTPALGPVINEKAMQRIGEEGVLAVICDSTNAVRSGTSPSESDILESLGDIMARSGGRVAIATFASNAGRFRSICQAAKRNNRRVMLVGRAVRRVADISSELGYFNDIDEFLSQDHFDSIDRDGLVIILTGSQGENRAAIARIARQEHPDITLTQGDTVIFSSRVIPGNEKAIGKVQNLLIDQGIEVVSDQNALVHTSGHARQEELEMMYSWLKPQISVPVHGEARHLSIHARLAREWGVPHAVQARNGDLVRLAPGNPEIMDQVPYGRYYKDGKILGDEENICVSQRRKLANSGVVCLSVLLDAEGNVIDGIDLEVFGLPEMTSEGEEFVDVLYDAAWDSLDSIPAGRRLDTKFVQKTVYQTIRASVREYWGKKPVTIVFVMKGNKKR